MSEPECLPLKTVKDVITWKVGQDPLSIATVTLAQRKPLPNNAPRTLICHDMKGGYLEDRFVQGCHDPLSYRFYHWQCIDSFVYFSHHFVTIPPPCWTNMAHKHGVQMLGTLITEWDDGNKRCHEVIESEESYRQFADNLVLITQYYGFDGWLVNVENKVQEDKVQNLAGFVGYLTQKLHQTVPESKVIWYDSVIQSGELKWQDALNKENSMFFDVCDGIFLNYNWNDEKLTASKTMASSKDRAMDVYVGIDVFGRGCLGGGGYNTIEALTAIRRHNMSAAIFAQGWVYERHDQESFTQNENRFWRLLQHLLPIHDLTSAHIPLSTSFCQGFGYQYFLEGKLVSGFPWHNMNLQELQPTYTDAQFEGDKSQCCPSLSLCTDRAYSGGNCLQLQATFSMGTDPVMFRLFSMDITVEEVFLLSYTYCLPPDEHCDSFIEMEIEVNGKRAAFIFRGDNPQSKDVNWKDRVVSPCSEEEIKVIDKLCAGMMTENNVNHWKTRYFFVPGCDAGEEKCNFRILSMKVGLYTLLPGPSQMHILYLGQIQLMPKSVIKMAPHVTNIKSAANRLSWECDQLSDVSYFNIYTKNRDSEILMGQAQHCIYVLPRDEPDQEVDKSGESKEEEGGQQTKTALQEKHVIIQPVLRTGFVSPLKSCSSLTVKV